MNNKKQGNEFESRFCDILYDKGFWVHNLTQNKSGQPADVIAVKNNIACLIDCKKCTKNKFDLYRIEGNQHTSMRLWEYCGNQHAWFALELNDGSIWMLAYKVCNLLLHDIDSLNELDIKNICIPLKEWVIQ